VGQGAWRPVIADFAAAIGDGMMLRRSHIATLGLPRDFVFVTWAARFAGFAFV
jgi:hypothetical protein